MSESEFGEQLPVTENQEPSSVPRTLANAYKLTALGGVVWWLLLPLAIGLLAWFVHVAAVYQQGILSLVATIMLLASLVWQSGPRFIRVGLLALMTINVMSFVINTQYAIVNEDYQLSDVPNVILFCCLTTAFLIEAGALLAICSTATRYKLAAWSLFAIPAVIYVAVIPVFDWIWVAVEADEQKLALRDPDWKLWNEVAFRVCEFAVFGFFTYLGACLGSFLNVVAYSVPRGESITFRDSKCQQCGQKISRIDNLPVFSYLNLGAQCRSCSAYIPVRYLIAELVVALIFGSLFLYELVTGCQNVPSMFVTHKGILWVILYPKWPAIWIYIYHVLFMSSLLVVAIIERDRQPMKWLFSSLLAAAFFVAALAYWPIHPVSATNHLPFLQPFSPVVDQLLKMAVGGLAGMIVAFGLSLIDPNWRASTIRFALLLTGIVLGWQALAQIMVVYMIVWLAALFLPGEKKAAQYPTALWLLAVMVHHPFWKMIAEWWH